jgi:hypothetical protein
MWANIVEYFGTSVATGDVDADGIPDLATVALATISYGEVYVYSGALGTRLLPVSSFGRSGVSIGK